jgi:hypothetical protein
MPKGMELFAQDLFGGADADHRLPVRVFTEYAWHSLFIRNLLLRPERLELQGFAPEMTIVDLPSFKADPARHGCRSRNGDRRRPDRKIVLIGGTSYAGEMKKSVFTVLNHLLPEKGIMPMHCSANVGDNGDTAVFFGLSGTGKTTLSADPSRTLIGDDEHGWSENGVFNFEGGCYAKTINLSAEAEPEIYSTTQRFGTVLENVVLDEKPGSGFRRRLEDGEHPRGLPDPLHFQRKRHRLRAGTEDDHHADRRCLRCDAADREAHPGAGDVSLPVRLHRQGGRHRKGRHRTPGHLLHLLRRAVPAAPSVRIRQPAEGSDRQAQGRLLAGQHRLDRRRLRRRVTACRSRRPAPC